MPKILITNSHADNRGDEAAQRAMIEGLAALVPDASFTVLTISPEGLQLPAYVKVIRTFSACRRNILAYLGWTALKSLGLRLPTFGRRSLEAIGAMADADVIISAPGGPYVGDLYASHEITEHLFHIFLAKLLRKPVMIYAPSIGPFKLKRRNILRRYILNKVEIISLRDSISQQYLEELKLKRPLIYVTADSAFQHTGSLQEETVRNIMIEERIADEKDEAERRPLVGITPTGEAWNYRGIAHSSELADSYNRVMAKTIDYLADSLQAKIVFFPQLYGNSDDLTLINNIVSLARRPDAVRILSEKWDSNVQQAVISKMDLIVGNRYHSVIFGLKESVPTVCLAYEHKSVSIMNAVDLSDYVIRIADLDYERLTAKIDQAWRDRGEIRLRLQSKLPRMRELACMNSLLAAGLIRFAKSVTRRPAALEEAIATSQSELRAQLPLTAETTSAGGRRP